MRTVLLLLTLTALPYLTRGQQTQEADTIPTRSLDSIGATIPGDEVVRIESYAARFDPQRALLLSAVFPGAGQIYNRAYWKVPIVYGGFVGLGLYLHQKQVEYLELKDMLFNILNEPATGPIVVDKTTGLTSLGNYVVAGRLVSSKGKLTIDQLRAYVNRWERDRNFAVMLTGLWYVLQLVEAHVDAHLKEFDINPQLKASILPDIRSNVLTGRTGGLSLTLKF